MIATVEKLNKRKAILNTTLKLISSNGFHAAPMSVIAREAGVAAGTIYLYFENKEDLIIQLYKYVKEILGNSILISEKNISYKQKVFDIWQHVYSFFCNQTEKYKFLEQYEDSPFITHKIAQEVDVFFCHLHQFLQEGIEQGFLRSIDEKIVMILLFRSISTAMKLKIMPTLTYQEEQTPLVIFQSFWDGVKMN
jgi:AcrR family transcriptional regulator